MRTYRSIIAAQKRVKMEAEAARFARIGVLGSAQVLLFLPSISFLFVFVCMFVRIRPPAPITHTRSGSKASGRCRRRCFAQSSWQWQRFASSKSCIQSDGPNSMIRSSSGSMPSRCLCVLARMPSCTHKFGPGMRLPINTRRHKHTRASRLVLAC